MQDINTTLHDFGHLVQCCALSSKSIIRQAVTVFLEDHVDTVPLDMVAKPPEPYPPSSGALVSYLPDEDSL